MFFLRKIFTMISTTAKKITKATTKPMHNVKSVAANDDDGASIGDSVPYIVIVFNPVFNPAAK